ncbi:MAG: hypothetical protein LBC47_02840 [Tannerella sp.]|jgi:hypothetical protein|nr:hypothetical protein [Tannerella sp.]
MEFIMIIAPWLPVLAVVYILIKCRYFILALYYAVKGKVTGRVSVPVSNERPTVAVSPAAFVNNYHELMGYAALFIFSICLSNTENKYNDAEQREVRLNDEQMNRAFAELMSADRKIDD